MNELPVMLLFWEGFPKVSWDTKSILFYWVIEAWQTKISKQINKIYENICKTVTLATGIEKNQSLLQNYD